MRCSFYEVLSLPKFHSALTVASFLKVSLFDIVSILMYMNPVPMYSSLPLFLFP